LTATTVNGTFIPFISVLARAIRVTVLVFF